MDRFIARALCRAACRVICRAMMDFHPTPIAGVHLIDTRPWRDERGSFVRVFCAQTMAPLSTPLPASAEASQSKSTDAPLAFVQVNVSRTRAAGTVRGLHLQRGAAAETKLIRCLRGRVFDVVVDLRPASLSYLQWYATELADERQILIPPGCAHGFQALTDDVELLYQHSASYAPALEDGVRFDDPTVAITWPLPPINVSARDLSFAPLAAREHLKALA